MAQTIDAHGHHLREIPGLAVEPYNSHKRTHLCVIRPTYITSTHRGSPLAVYRKNGIIPDANKVYDVLNVDKKYYAFIDPTCVWLPMGNQRGDDSSY